MNSNIFEEWDLQETYYQIQNSLKDIERIDIKLKKLDTIANTKFLYILDDINLILLTYNHIGNLYCEKQTYNLLTLQRILVIEFSTIYGKIKDIDRLNGDQSLKRILKDIMSEMGEDSADVNLKVMRNCIIHNVDYLYTDYFILKKVFTIRKQVKLLQLFLEYIIRANRIQVNIKKNLGTINNKLQKNNTSVIQFNPQTQISLIELAKVLEPNVIKNKTALLVLDILHKLYEIGQLMYHTYEESEEGVYWGRICIIFEYQMLDKIGKFLGMRYLGTGWDDINYYKATVDDISNLGIVVDVIDRPLLTFLNSVEYNNLNVLRQAIEHKTEHLQYRKTNKTFVEVGYNFYNLCSSDILRWGDDYAKNRMQ